MAWIRPVTHVMPMAEWRYLRRLPGPGRLLARAGTLVKPGEAVAEIFPPPRYRLVDVARALGVPPGRVEAFLRVREGETVEQGDPLAERRGLFRRVVRAPVDGEIVLISDGQVLLQVDDRDERQQLLAGVAGRVTRVEPPDTVEITTTVALVDGVWGNGKLAHGVLHVMLETPGERLEADHLTPPLRGAVVLGGFCDDPRVLEWAQELPLRGLILASMRARLVPLAQRLDLPVLVLEGFGHLPLNEAAFKLLTSYHQREVAVLAETPSHRLGRKPRVAVRLDVGGAPEVVDAAELQPGRKVRILRAPYAGQVGTVVSLRSGRVALPSGVRALAVEVRLEDGARVLVPLTNLEILA